jgi:signal transduction histidine kinase
MNDWWNFVDIKLVCPNGSNCDAGLLTRIATTTGMIGLVFAAWASGERLRSARLGQAALADRAAQLEREREQQARIAAAAERARIAREMHDVIAHALSVMIAQADGAAYIIDADPAGAKAALERISGTGRDSLTQMRGLLGLLRSEDGGGQDRTSGPQPGVGQLEQLIEDARQTGLQVDYRTSGSEAGVAQMLGLTVYRVVQECLTNARKHGGDQVEVVIDFGDDGIDLQVRNDAPADTKRLQTGAPGHGMQGMRERVAAVGGKLSAGPTPDGFAIHAWMPKDRATVSPDS